jgi:Na+/proline symporter
VILTDFLLFIIAMFGSIAAAVVALRQAGIGGLSGLVDHPAVAGKLSILPDFDAAIPGNVEFIVAAFIVPLAVQWWAAWYPGAEPGGGGYVAQRMLAARDERHAVGATVLFNAAHYALRPWPWILVALCSLVVFPDLASLQARFPEIPADKIGHDLAYPAMLTYLPHGLLGLVLASLGAAYMSTISTHLNWGASYVVNDLYRRFIDPSASERRLVLAGRVSTVLMVVLAATLALALQNALQAFGIILQIGAGTGLLFLVRWFWWRVNAWSEITAMVVSFGVALYFQFAHFLLFPGSELAVSSRFLIGVAVTTAAWIFVTLMTRPTEAERLREFCRVARPGGPGWRKFLEEQGSIEPTCGSIDSGWDVPRGLVCMIAASSAVYATLFSTGHALYGEAAPSLALAAVAALSLVVLYLFWRRARGAEPGESR